MTTAAGIPDEAGPGGGPADWLERQGPHALVRTVRRGAGWTVLALAVRPGGPTNTLSAIAVCLESDDGATLTTDLPVFERYRRQWSLDLTAGFPADDLAGAANWHGAVVLVDADGERSLPLLAADPEAFAMFSPPDLAGRTRPWLLTGSTDTEGAV